MAAPNCEHTFMEGGNRWTPDLEELLKQWLSRTRLSQHSHHEAGKYYRLMNNCLLIPTIFLGSSLSALGLYYLDSTTPQNVKYLTVTGSIIITIFTTLQANIKFGELSERHSKVGARYGAVRRRIEQLLATPSISRLDPTPTMDDLRKELDSLGEEGPVVKRSIFEKTKILVSVPPSSAK